MAYCAYCGNQISELAVTCPKCGRATEAPAIVEQPVARAVPYAGFWRRFLALLIDSLLLSIVGLFIGTSRPRPGEPAGFYIREGLYGAGAIVTFVYRWLMISFVNGQTIGKMAMGIRIARPDGSPVDLGRSAARAAMAIVSAAAILLGYFWAIWDPERRTWHDSVADTRAFMVRR